ncbi:MAG: hypothetical protein RMX35_11710, partial [Nostoc sp. DcaGUA01]|nr:hypothetical protein [Nostoc sp. DcaGUA01]
DERVSEVDERVSEVDERVSEVDERVFEVDERVSEVDERVFEVDKRVSEGLPTNKLSNLVGWTSCPPFLMGGRDAHPTRKVEYFLFGNL